MAIKHLQITFKQDFIFTTVHTIVQIKSKPNLPDELNCQAGADSLQSP